MKYVLPAIRMKILMMVLLGLIYPLSMTGLSQILFPKQASGDFVRLHDQIVGSRLIAQKFEKPGYFWPRPSIVDYNPLPSGGSNWGQASLDLKKIFDERKDKLKAAHPDISGDPPQELLFASGSGLDPHISPVAARYQMSRVAKVRNLPIENLDRLIEQNTKRRLFGFLGEPVVNVLELNLELDSL